MSSLCRAKAKDGREVVGCILFDEEDYYIMDETVQVKETRCAGDFGIAGGLFAIDPATAAFDTDRKDKHDKPIFGSKGEFQGGDKVQLSGQGGAVPVVWNKDRLWWGFPEGAELGCWKSDELEIVKEAE